MDKGVVIKDERIMNIIHTSNYLFTFDHLPMPHFAKVIFIILKDQTTPHIMKNLLYFAILLIIASCQTDSIDEKPTHLNVQIDNSTANRA